MKKISILFSLSLFISFLSIALAQDDADINKAKLKMIQDKATGKEIQYKKDKEALKDLRKAKRNLKKTPPSQKQQNSK